MVDACEREIRRWILTGSLQPGERLPPERTLAVRLGVNRSTLRSALTRLATSRLLHVRQGSGYVVQDFRCAGGLELLVDVVASQEDLRETAVADLLGVRRALLRAALLERTDRPEAAVELARGLARQLAGAAPKDHELIHRVLSMARTPVLALAFNPVALALRALPVHEGLDRRAPALGQALLRWAERPSAPALDALVADLERRDLALLVEP